MHRTARRNVLAHKGRLLMTVLAVLLGTAFVAGTMIFADSVSASATNSISNSYSGVAIQVTDTATGPGCAGPSVHRRSAGARHRRGERGAGTGAAGRHRDNPLFEVRDRRGIQQARRSGPW